MMKLQICAKCSDLFSATLTDDGGMQHEYHGYVPDFMPGEHWGDYVTLEIDTDTGTITNWSKPTKKDLKATFETFGRKAVQS
jgi:hypothetical protein